MRFSRSVTLLAGLAAILFTGCATKETIPMFRVSPNASGIETGASSSHPPISLLGFIGSTPDVPSGVYVSVQRIRPLHNKEPRYFISASGGLTAVSIERPADYNTKYRRFDDQIDRWKQLLDGEHIPNQEARRTLSNQLSEVPWTNAGRCFHAKLRRRTFPWGKAVLFLTTYVQGKTGGPVNNDMLVLVVQGLTNDGRYAVNGHFEIRHPKLPESSWDKHVKGKAVFDIDEEDKQAEQWLDAQPDDSFAPTFHQYETFLESLQIEAPATR